MSTPFLKNLSLPRHFARTILFLSLGLWGPFACKGGGGGRDIGEDVPIVLPDVVFSDTVSSTDSNLEDLFVFPSDRAEIESLEAEGTETQSLEESKDGTVEEAQPDISSPEGCGDGVCSPQETCETCPTDCGTCPCGDGKCDVAVGETCATCPKDCGTCPMCGDQKCDEPLESCSLCPNDCGPCPPQCQNGLCEGGEDCKTCPEDCGPCTPSCPDGYCNGDETCKTCPADCGECPPYCGDGLCNGTETCEDCPGDCGECPPQCGDGQCLGDEDCHNCPSDCGECPPTLWFRADWSETLDAPIVAGGKLRIRYDLERLTQCRQTVDGHPAWTITVFYTDDLSKPAQSVEVVMHDDKGNSWPIEPVIDVPKTAHDLWFWANNTGPNGCIAWDSDFGKNYLMPVFTTEEVSAPVGWLGWGLGALDFAWIGEGGPSSKGDVDPVYFFESLLGAEVTTAIRVQVYVPGITDRVYQNQAVSKEVAHTAVTMVVLTDFARGAGYPGALPVTVPMEFEFQANNNFFYRWYFGSYSYTHDIAPLTPMGTPPSGLYSYWLIAKTHKGAPTKVGQPYDSTKPRRLVYAANPDEGCPLFPENPPPEICH